jgi:hypothetical protein
MRVILIRDGQLVDPPEMREVKAVIVHSRSCHF